MVFGRPGGEQRAVEVFALTAPAGSAAATVAAEERAVDREAHVAFDVERPDPLVLRGLRAGFLRYGAAPDGGGYNPHEDGTVFYFAAPDETKTPYRRVELYARGDHRDVLAEHLDERRAYAHPAETLLRLLTGAWTTQALAVCAELRLPEAMSPRTARGAEALAPVVGARPENLATLLRYLAMVGVVAEEPGARGTFRLTEAGLLLREDAEGSVRALALMYGGPFYESFEQARAHRADGGAGIRGPVRREPLRPLRARSRAGRPVRPVDDGERPDVRPAAASPGRHRGGRRPRRPYRRGHRRRHRGTPRAAPHRASLPARGPSRTRPRGRGGAVPARRRRGTVRLPDR